MKPFIQILALAFVLVVNGATAGGAEAQSSSKAFASTAIRVSNLDRSVIFYTTVLGLKVSRRYADAEGPSVALSATGAQDENTLQIVLVQKGTGSALDIGTGLNRIGYYYTDAKAVVERARAAGAKIVSEATDYRNENLALLAFLKDPDGYVCEIMQPHAKAGPVPPASDNGSGLTSVALTALNVSDQGRSLDFYKQILGLKAVGNYDSKTTRNAALHVDGASTSPVNGGPVLVLIQDLERKEPIKLGNGPSRISFYVTDAKAAINSVRGAGFEVVSEPKPHRDPKIAKLVGLVKDADGFPIEILQR